jgi:hypothetical protein
VEGQYTGAKAAGQSGSVGLACNYNNKSPRAVRTKAVEMCESGAYLVVSWDLKNPSKPFYHPFKCRSWRHVGECQRWKGAQDYVRVSEAMTRIGEQWVYSVLTFDPKHFQNEWAAYRGGLHRWQKLNQRLSRAYGPITYLQTWEKHTRSDFPHVNVAIHNSKIWALCRGDGWKSFRRYLNQQAVACGFGQRIWLEPLRAGMTMDFAGYLTKLNRELTGAGTKNQVPVNAPKNFRRFRASQGLLPKPFHREGFTGVLIPAKLLGTVDIGATMSFPAGKAQKRHPGRKLGEV